MYVRTCVYEDLGFKTFTSLKFVSDSSISGINYVYKSLFAVQNLSDGEMERELGLRNSLHRLKVCLAVQSMLKAQSGQVLPHPVSRESVSD